MRCLLVIVLVVWAVPAGAQPPAPPTGDQLIDRFELAEVRRLAGELAALPTIEPLDEARFAAVVAYRARHPVLHRLGALDDAELERIAQALCPAGDAACVAATTRTMRCLADRCSVVLPPSTEDDGETPGLRLDCAKQRRRKPTPLLGLGFDWGNGLQRSGGANDGRATSLGISARVRLSERLGVIARADRIDGRDEATDTDGDGVDDFESTAITRFTAMAGPSFVLDSTKLERSTRSVRLDLLAGYLGTRTLPGEDGLAIGADLGLQLAVFRAGVRVVQGLGDASRATNVLLHLGITVGATPVRTEEDRCPPGRRSSRLAIGFELPFTGGGFSSQLGYLAIGFGGELLWHLLPRLDAVVHADLLVFPRRDRDRVIHQAALAGIRIDHGRRPRRKKTGWSSTLMAGMTRGADLEPSTVGDGPIADAAIAWGGQDDESAGYLRLHGRFGLAPSNRDYRAVFLAIGFELRFDRRRWSDRDRVW